MAKAILADLDFENVARILNLPDAVSSSEPVTLNQLNNAIEGLNWKDSVRAATTANLALTGPGSVIDSIVMQNGDRLLVKNQTSEAENGIYIFNGSGVALTRAADANTFAELHGAVVIVEQGAANAGTAFRQTQVDGTIGSSPLVWTTFLSGSPDASEVTKGILELATQAEVDAGVDDVRAITPLKLKNSKWFAQSKIFTIGNGSASSFNCDHNLNNRGVSVTVFRNSGSFEDVLADVTRPSVNRVTVTFSAPPAINGFIVVVHGQLA
jgi:hypothetical protein